MLTVLSKKIKAFCYIYFDFRLFYQLAAANYKHIIPFIRAFVNTFFKKISERSHAPKFIKSQNIYSHIIQSVFFYNIFNHLNIFFCADGRCVFIFQKGHRNSEFSMHPSDCKSLVITIHIILSSSQIKTASYDSVQLS